MWQMIDYVKISTQSHNSSRPGYVHILYTYYVSMLYTNQMSMRYILILCQRVESTKHDNVLYPPRMSMCQVPVACKHIILYHM